MDNTKKDLMLQGIPGTLWLCECCNIRCCCDRYWGGCDVKV